MNYLRMKKLVLLSVLFSFFFLFARAQADSLLFVLEHAPLNDKARICNELSAIFQKTDSARSMKYAREALSLASLNNQPGECSDSWFNMGECLYCFEEFVKARDFYSKSFEFAKTVADSIRMGEILNTWALTYYFSSEYDLAIGMQMEALRYLNSADREEIRARVYSNIGMVYSRLGDFRKNISYCRKAVAINKKNGDIFRAAFDYNGMGIAYYSLGMPDSAGYFYRLALKGFQSANDRDKVAATLSNLANVLVDKGDSMEKAMDYFQQALDVFEELSDVRNAAFVIESQGAAYLKMGNAKKAIETLHPGLELAKKHRLGYFIHQAYYGDISGAYEKTGKIQEAFDAYKLHRIYLDSLRQEERIKQVNELETKFETERKEEEIRRLHAEKELASVQIQEEKTMRTFMSVLLALTLAIVAYVSYAYFSKRKTNRILKQKNEQIENQKDELIKVNATKNKFFSILAHDLKNPFHTIMGYASLLDRDYERFTDGERRKYAGDIYKSAGNVFRLLQNLLDWSRSQSGALKYNPVSFELKPVAETVISLLKPLASEKKLVMENRIPGDLRIYADPMMVETIIRNLTSNAVKFSHPEGEILISAVPEPSGKILLCVRDEGTGILKEEQPQLFALDSKIKRKGTKGEDGSGLGLSICMDFVRLNGGDIWVESEPGRGSTFCVTFPARPSLVKKPEIK